MKENQHIQSVLVKKSNQDKIEYWVQLNTIVDCIRFLLSWGIAFLGHDEFKVQVIKEISLSFYNFWQIIMNLSMKCCKKLWKIAITHHEIQKDIVNAVACETSKAIIKDLDNGFFSI